MTVRHCVLCAVCCMLCCVCTSMCSQQRWYQSLINSSLAKSCRTGGGLSVNYSSDEVTPTLQEYASQLFEACPSLSCTPSSTSSIKSVERGEGRAKREGGDMDDDRPRLTIITGAIYFISLPISVHFPFWFSCLHTSHDVKPSNDSYSWFLTQSLGRL